MIIGHIGGAGSPYEIQKSLRFRSNASAYLSRTPTVAGNRKTWTWSGWVKRGTLGVQQGLFAASESPSSEALAFSSSDQLVAAIYDNPNVTNIRISSAVFRDPSSWYHIMYVWDTSNATAQLRARVYVNGVELTSWATNNTLTQDYVGAINGTTQHTIGSNTTVQYTDGYLSEINFIDGQALDPSYFGQVSAETGAWIPKKYAGTYGANGFYLPFNDGSNLTNLTADRSGNGNNWTASNISLTSGVTYDWMDDTPTNNFAVLNPLQSRSTPSRASLEFTQPNAGHGPTVGTIGMTTGKWYWEVEITTFNSTSSSIHIGIVGDNYPFTSGNYIGNTSTSYGYRHSGQKYNNTSQAAYGAAYTAGDVIGVALDLDAGTLVFYKNNSSQGTAYSSLSGTFYPGVSIEQAGSTSTVQVNFGQRQFAYAPPAGFKALCTKSLPTPSILNPKKHFDVKTRTGTGAAATVTGIPFAPDLVWIKARAAAYSHNITDSVRGAAKTLISNATAAEEHNRTVGYVSAFTSDGYSLSAGSSSIDEVGAATAYVDWLWKAGGAPVTNNAGSIQSQVSANPQAGFSIVTYTGTGANATVGHGLGVAPKMVVFKKRSAAGDWLTFFNLNGVNKYLYFNQTAAAGNASQALPTSTVVDLGADPNANGSGATQVAYCFAEIPGFSKIGSYTGNGSADGPFIWCGFRPKFVMYKRVDAAANWYIEDAARNPNNIVNISLSPNLTSVDYNGGGNEIDFLANGFKFRTASAEQNTSGGSYIFYAVAEQPFQFANAR